MPRLTLASLAAASWLSAAPHTGSSRLGSWIAQASPDQAVWAASVGLCLIFFELNRPGSIVPGAGGLTLTLLAVASLGLRPLQAWAVLLVALALAMLVANLWRVLPPLALLAGTAALIVALRFLVAPWADRTVDWLTALPCGLLVGGLGSVLTRIALRARRAKAVN